MVYGIFNCIVERSFEMSSPELSESCRNTNRVDMQGLVCSPISPRKHQPFFHEHTNHVPAVPCLLGQSSEHGNCSHSANKFDHIPSTASVNMPKLSTRGQILLLLKLSVCISVCVCNDIGILLLWQVATMKLYERGWFFLFPNNPQQQNGCELMCWRWKL